MRFTALAAVFVALAGCGREPVAGLGTPDRVTLYSLDGRDYHPGVVPEGGEVFHRVKVLGKVELTDPTQRQGLLNAFRRGAVHNDGAMMKCFWPRHGIRVVEGDRVTDFVICFQCQQFETHDGDSGRRNVKVIAAGAQPEFDATLTAAGVPLAPK